MNPSGYTIEVTSLSHSATEKDVYDFFAFSGTIEHVEIIRYGECACTAYVTFKDAHAQETAVLLSLSFSFTDKISVGVETAKSVDDKYRVSETTKSALSAVGRTAAAAATTVVNSSYFSWGALCVSDALAKAAKVAADLGSQTSGK
ncbi:hypothetical protein MKX01_026635 [Papaver californicum]|nr:hypothetical protein MKX01_026635 [Papaver californicum]